MNGSGSKSAAGAIVIAGTLDTKSDEIAFVRDELRGYGLDVIVIDCGVLGQPSIEADIDRRAIAKAGGGNIDELRERGNREVAIATMVAGLESEIAGLVGEGRIAGFLAIGGGTNAALASVAFKVLPFGIPKMLVSTVACGNTRPFVGIKDAVLIHSVVDILGLNAFVRGILRQAAAGLSAMVRERSEMVVESALCVGLTSYGSTTDAANRCYANITERGLDCLAFHARGIGGEAMERLIDDGAIQAVLDLTTTEIADEIVGGICSAGLDRLSAAARKGLPQVVLPGGVDIVNFGPPETVPPQFSGRVFARHTPHATLMRTTPEENVKIAQFIAGRLNVSEAPVSVVLPEQGFSAYSREDRPFYDPAADRAFMDTLVGALRPEIQVYRIDAHINDPVVADRASELLLAMLNRQ